MKPQNCRDDQPLVLKLKGGVGGGGVEGKFNLWRWNTCSNTLAD